MLSLYSVSGITAPNWPVDRWLFYFQGFPYFEARMTLVHGIQILWTLGNFLPLVILAFFVAQMPVTALRINL